MSEMKLQRQKVHKSKLCPKIRKRKKENITEQSSVVYHSEVSAGNTKPPESEWPRPTERRWLLNYVIKYLQ